MGSQSDNPFAHIKVYPLESLAYHSYLVTTNLSVSCLYYSGVLAQTDTNQPVVHPVGVMSIGVEGHALVV